MCVFGRQYTSSYGRVFNPPCLECHSSGAWMCEIVGVWWWLEKAVGAVLDHIIYNINSQHFAIEVRLSYLLLKKKFFFKGLWNDGKTDVWQVPEIDKNILIKQSSVFNRSSSRTRGGETISPSCSIIGSLGLIQLLLWIIFNEGKYYRRLKTWTISNKLYTTTPLAAL